MDIRGELKTMGITLGASPAHSAKVRGTQSNPKALHPPRLQDTAYIASMLMTGPERETVFSEGFSQSLRDWYDRVAVKETITNTEAAIL